MQNSQSPSPGAVLTPPGPLQGAYTVRLHQDRNQERRLQFPSAWARVLRRDHDGLVVINRGIVTEHGAVTLAGMRIVARTMENLEIFPASIWDRIHQELLGSGSMYDEEFRQRARARISNAIECRLDARGRISMPASLRRAARLTESIVMVGLGDRIELWNLQDWRRGSG
ncbi:MAG: hypothetical protein U1F68_14565 [Gammaproteobacteria bacterium]